MLSTFITAFVLLGVLSAYTFLGHNLMHMAFESDLEGRSRIALQVFEDDIHNATGFVTAAPVGPPSSTSFEVNTLIEPGFTIPGTLPWSTPPVPVLGQALYTYTAPTGSTPGTLTVVHTTPVAAATLENPGWPTQDVSQASAPRTLVTGITAMSIGYFDINGIPTTNPAAIKMMNLSFSLVSPVTQNPAQASKTVVSPLVMLKNVSYPHDP